MPHFTLDLREEFRAGVVTPWLDDHAAGLTPNPCVRCNGHVRLDAMLEFAQRLGAPTLATGHYARQSPDGLLRSAADPAKDQAYMLCALSPATIAQLRFPLGELTKPEARALAAEAGLPVASKADPWTSASSPARAAPRSSRATAARASAWGRSSTAAGRCSAATAGTTASPSASARGSGSPRRSRSTSSPPTRAPTR